VEEDKFLEASSRGFRIWRLTYGVPVLESDF